MIKPRHRVFLDELPKNKNKILPAALKAGYSEVYARKQGKILMNNALKANAKDIIEQVENKTLSAIDAKQKMHELLGYSRSDVFERLRMIADQEKDLASKLKVLSPLAKELGIDLSPEEQSNITVPVLNVVVEKPKEGLVEPQNVRDMGV